MKKTKAAPLCAMISLFFILNYHRASLGKLAKTQNLHSNNDN